MKEADSEIPTSFPIPLSLVPPHTHVDFVDSKPHIVFDKEYDPQELSPETSLFTENYLPKVSAFLSRKYAAFEDGNNPKWSELVNLYGQYLYIQWNMLHLLVNLQNQDASEGRIDRVDRMNQEGEHLSFPEVYQSLAPQVFLHEKLSRVIARMHPSYRRYSKTDEALAVSGEIKADNIIIKINDPDIVRAQAENDEIRKKCAAFLESKPEMEMVELFLASDEEKSELAEKIPLE